jgi:hypothetical protein
VAYLRLKRVLTWRCACAEVVVDYSMERFNGNIIFASARLGFVAGGQPKAESDEKRAQIVKSTTTENHIVIF